MLMYLAHQWCYQTLILNCGSGLRGLESCSWLCYWLALWPCHLTSQFAPFVNEDHMYPSFYKVLSELWVNRAAQVVRIIYLLPRARMCITPLRLCIFIVHTVTIVSFVALWSEERRWYRTGFCSAVETSLYHSRHENIPDLQIRMECNLELVISLNQLFLVPGCP